MNNKTARKVIVLVLAITLVLSVMLTACKPAEESAVTAEPESSTEVPAATDVAATEEPTEEPTQAPTEEPTEAPTKEPVASGTNVALDADVDVSSTTGDLHIQWGWSYEYINDGLYFDIEENSAGWTTAVGENMTDPDQEEWATFSLAQETTINKVIVYPVQNGRHFPESFKILVSSDGKNYTAVAEVNDNTRAADGDETPFVLEFDAVTCLYVQFLATKQYRVPSAADGYLCQVSEIEIFAA